MDLRQIAQQLSRALIAQNRLPEALAFSKAIADLWPTMTRAHILRGFALAVSGDEQPTLYIATFKPSTHVASLWALHDTGGAPQGPPSIESPVASGSRVHSGDDSIVSQILAAPQLPYVGLGIGALAVILTAVAAHLRGRYR